MPFTNRANVPKAKDQDAAEHDESDERNVDEDDAGGADAEDGSWHARARVRRTADPRRALIRKAECEELARVTPAADGHDDVLLAVDHVRHR